MSVVEPIKSALHRVSKYRGTDGTPPIERFDAVADANPTRKPWKYTGNCLTIRFRGGMAEGLEYAHFPEGHLLNICRVQTTGQDILEELPERLTAYVNDSGHKYVVLDAPAKGFLAAERINVVAKTLGYENGLADAAFHRRRSV